jgi:hypothetical protein
MQNGNMILIYITVGVGLKDMTVHWFDSI